MLAALGIFAPVYLMVILLAPLFRRYAQNPYVRSFVSGVTAAAAGAIAGAAVVIARRTIYDFVGCGIAAASVLVLLRWKLSEPVVVALGALAGWCAHVLLH
jgi:chromate transporter